METKQEKQCLNYQSTEHTKKTVSHLQIKNTELNQLKRVEPVSKNRYFKEK